MENLKIGIIEPVGGHGGMNFYDYGLAGGLAHNNLEVYFFTANATKQTSINGVHTIYTFASIWKKKSKLAKCIQYFKGVFTTIRFSKKHKISILHLHAFHIDWLFFLAVTICKLFNFKVVVTVHDITTFAGHKMHPYFEKKLIYSIDEVIVHNKFSLNEISQLLPQRNYHLIPHGNYVPFVKKVTPQQTNDLFKLLFFGQIKQVKGLDVLLKAMAIIKQRNLNCQLTIAGKVWKDSFEKYQTIINENGLADVVKADIKYIQDDMIWNYFNDANLVVLPYRRIYQSGVLLMAMSFGRAVLASNLPAFTEVIRPNVNGYLFKTEDPVSLANTIQEIILSNTIQAVEVQGYKTVVENYDWNKIGAQTKKVYSKLIPLTNQPSTTTVTVRHTDDSLIGQKQ